MCDASDYAVGAVLGQRVDKKLNVIHYASKTLDNAQRNYATTEKEFLAVVFACDKFRPYDPLPIDVSFLDEQLNVINTSRSTPWYADYANYIVANLYTLVSHNNKRKSSSMI